MNPAEPLWRFHPVVDGTRAARLYSYATFETVAPLVTSPQLSGFAWERFCGVHLEGCHRASFRLVVSPVAYDAFFNSPVGYRGQYARSVQAGEEANRMLLMQLEPKLVVYGAAHSAVDCELIRKSLRGIQAKVWILESEVESQLGGTSPEISYAPWEQCSENGVGLLAPVGTLLEVKGGWVNLDGCERVNPTKVQRSEEIHLTGYS